MMYKFLLVLMLSSFSLYADKPAIDGENFQLGRYQMIRSESNTHLYLLDTATGQVWKSTQNSNGVSAFSWNLIISGFPTYP